MKNTEKNYQETTKQTNARVQLEVEGWGLLLQQIQPVATLIITWAIISARAEVNPRAIAGLRGYVHWVVDVNWTSEPCTKDHQWFLSEI